MKKATYWKVAIVLILLGLAVVYGFVELSQIQVQKP
jgi:hypothetical protein